MPSKRQKPGDVPAPKAPAERRQIFTGILSFLERHAFALTVVFIFLGTVRIVATYNVFSHTYDEPAHIACGMEWIDKGVYKWEPQHPPLARVAAALGPYLLGARSQGTQHGNNFLMMFEGLGILFNGHKYDLTLGLARLGILPFFWLGCLAQYWWGRRYGSNATAVVGLFLFSFLPPILAHAGLATTDMACTACLAAAFLTAMIWVEEPTPRRAALFGLAGGLAMVSKFSTLPYFAAAMICAAVWYCVTERPGVSEVAALALRRLPSLAISAAVAFLVIWTTYRFSFGKVFFANISLPAPEFFAGIRDVLRHNAEGHPGYLLGKRSEYGFWYFYPVDLAIKTPLALLILLGFGIGPSIRKHSGFRLPWLAVAFSAGILGVALFSHINIGIRHVMPIYVGFALIAAVGTVHMLESATLRPWSGWAAILLVGWYAGSSLISHPDYLPYFNLLAGSHPENVVVDSDLDWGQDVKRLGARLRAVGAPEVYFVPMDVVSAERGDLERGFGFPRVNTRVDALNPSPGWNAVGLTALKQRRLGMGDQLPQYQPWPERVLDPGELIGKSIRLWYFPPTPKTSAR